MVKEFTAIHCPVCSQDTNIYSYSQQETTAKSKICSLGPALPQMPQQERTSNNLPISQHTMCTHINLHEYLVIYREWKKMIYHASSSDQDTDR